jgi:PE-PPE domain
MVATAGAGFLSMAAMMNTGYAHADDGDLGLVMGGSGLPIPGPEYVGAANALYLDNLVETTPLYPDLTFYQAAAAPPYGNGLFTPEGLYPLTGVHTLPLNYPLDANGLPDGSTSVGQGATILQSTITADQAAGDTSTVFGYSQSSTLSGITMQMLDPSGTPETGAGAPQFLLIADPSAPNGGLLERFNGFESTINGAPATTVDPLNLPSVGISFDGATPSDDFVTNMYSLEYDGFTDFPRYPLNFLSDLNAFLGIETLHGTYLNGGVDGSGPTAAEIAGATLLPGSALSGTADSLTNYYMIDETAPLVSLLPKSLQELLGPDLTYLINLGYGDGTLGYSQTVDSPANVATPFGLSPVSSTTEFNTLVTDTQQGIQNLMSDTDPYAAAATTSASAGAEAATAVPAAAPTLTDIANTFSSALSTAYSTLLPLQDISNFLSTSLPAYDLSLFTDNLATGDLTDAFGLPVAANTALDTLAAGFATEVITNAASQIAADFSAIGF